MAEDLTLGEQHLVFWRERLTSLQCYVYVIQGDEGGPVKVGRAVDVRKRIAGLQTGNPQYLRLLYVLPGDNEVEWQLHRRLRGCRVRGEWFAGPKVAPLLREVESISERMVEDHTTYGVAPAFGDYAKVFSRPRRKEQGMWVEVGEPDPVDPEEARARLAAHWMRPARRGSYDGTSTGTIC